jgi:cation diffusion facilitator CzcD-associated flavoprotein CzcO
MTSEHVDVLIIGAGLSGIGAACHLRRDCPSKTFTLLEARHAIGGTWDLFRYPGIRSDSDMFTLGYSFAPWTGEKAIADGDTIRDYIVDNARAYDVEKEVRFGHKAVHAEWSSQTATWTVEVQRDTGETLTITCSFIFSCSGYYRYDEGYTPQFPGREDFTGQIIHPQHWPEDLDLGGKRVVVIGSGATAITLLPNLAAQAEHVTMLQRSPTYVVSRGAKDKVADLLRRALPAGTAYSIVRWKNVLMTQGFFLACRQFPGVAKKVLRRLNTKMLPQGYDVDKHFNPTYDPWDQRVCVVPDGDLFRALRNGSASIATDTINRFTADGIELGSGEHLPADVIVTATGLNLLLIGGLTLTVDGADVKPSERVAYKGMMLSGVPNFALALGYTNASWTLKCDLIAGYVCRLLNRMDATGQQIATPQAPATDSELEPLFDLKSGYVLRAIDQLPKQAEKAPWRLAQNYALDLRMMRRSDLDEQMEFSRAAG